MKSLILVATALLSLTSMAQVVESEIIENAAKSIRRSHWVQGYENVESSSYKVDEKYLAEYLAQPYYEERLNSEEIAEIEACIKNSICSAYNVLLSAEYWGGYGEVGFFVLIDLKSGRYTKDIEHVIYTE